MMHRFEGYEGYLAEVLDSVQGTLFVDLKLLWSYHFRTICELNTVKSHLLKRNPRS